MEVDKDADVVVVKEEKEENKVLVFGDIADGQEQPEEEEEPKFDPLRAKKRVFRHTPESSRRAYAAKKKKRSRNPHSNAVKATVTVFDSQLEYKHWGGAVLFKNSSVFALIQSKIPLVTNISDPKAASKMFHGSKRIESRQIHLQDTWEQAFVSLKALRTIVNQNIFNQALRDMLNTFRPFEAGEENQTGHEGGGGNLLEKDHITVCGMDIAFVVSGGKVSPRELVFSF